MEKKNNFLIKIKSKFILKQIFDNLKEKRLLEIIRYNKNIQNKLNKDIKDFKKEYYKIEIEIIPNKNQYGKFIRLPKRYEPYYHIYFNDGNEETKRKTLNGENISKIRVILDYKIKSLRKLFRKCKYIKKITFTKFKRKNIINMSKMFQGCSSLEFLDISNFNTDNVKNMSEMFYDCSLLKEIKILNFKTNNVTDMHKMFYNCSSLIELNLSNFNTNNVTNMNCMFFNCSSLKELDLSNFNTNNVSDMSCMFYNCSSLTELNLSNFNTNNVTNMRDMFFVCSDQFKNKGRAHYKDLKGEEFNYY